MMAIVAVTVAAGCTGGDGDDGGPSTTESPVPSTTSTTEVIVLPDPDVTVATTELTALGRSAESIFGSGISGGFELAELSIEADRTIRDQFVADERLEDVFVDVETRVVRRGGVDVAALAALALSPTAALSEEWRADFEAGVFESAIGSPSEVRIGTESLDAFTTEGPSAEVQHRSYLWRLDNVFVVMTSQDPDVLMDVANGLLEVLIGPIPTTTTTAPPTTLEG
ncbi:MAG: hypothetical protein AAGD18_05985 [Actinomycetota bacterium]